MKTIRKNFLLLAFAAGALFLIGNNVLADGPTEILVVPTADEVVITCTQEAGPGAQCWRKDWRGRCNRWTGYVNDSC